MTEAHLTIVGIGADGWEGLSERARGAVLDATLLVGSARQLALVPPTPAERRCWPSPIEPLVDDLASGRTGPACVLASGDPMLHGIGATLARRVGPGRLTVLPSLSAFSIACARLCWPSAGTDLVNLVGAPVEALVRWLQPGRRLIVYTHGPTGASEIANVLMDNGFGPSRLAVLELLGGPDERIAEATAGEWQARAPKAPYLVAVECRPDPDAIALPLSPGLADDAYEHDGQLTKREVRAVTMARLGPGPGELLWDVGAGSGSIAIEWLRCEPSARAVAIECDAERAERIGRNAMRLGVPRLDVRHGTAPEALAGLDRPEAIFVGGGLAVAGVLDTCWDRLASGGRLVANAVTIDGEQRLVSARETFGGDLVRISIERAEPIGGHTGWRPRLPIVQWAVRKVASS